MSCPFPPEILDLVVNDLHDQRDALLACGTVSKSWVPRTRRHLFARVEFGSPESSIESWIKTFPDPSNSPTHYTQSLVVANAQLVTVADMGVGRWIRAFHNIVHLYVAIRNSQLDDGGQVSLVPFYGLSPAVKSLHLYSITPCHTEVFSLLCSFPLLEDFALDACRGRIWPDKWETPLTSPRLTGSLKLGGLMEGGAGPIARRLLDLPGGLNFTKIVSAGACEDDFRATADLVSRCSGTIESLTISDCLLSVFLPTAALDQSLTVTIRAFRTGSV